VNIIIDLINERKRKKKEETWLEINRKEREKYW